MGRACDLLSRPSFIPEHPFHRLLRDAAAVKERAVSNVSRMNDPLGVATPFEPGPGKQGTLVSLPALEKKGFGRISRLPVSLRIVLESVARNVDGTRVTADDVRALAGW